MADSLPVYKIALLGKARVGKSTLAQKFFEANQISFLSQSSTVIYQKKVRLGGKYVQISLTDSPGSTYSSRLHKNIIEGSEGFAIVFSVTDRDSFKAVEEYRNQIIKMKKDNKFPMILVANNCDAEDWKVTPSEISAKANDWHMSYIETSTRIPKNIDKTFFEVAKMISVYQPPPDEGRQRSCCEIL